MGIERVAVLLQDDYFLGNINQPAGQVSAVGGPQGSVGQTFPGSVGGDEVLQGCEALTETGLDGQVNDPPFRIAHQAAHASHLFDLRDVTLCPRNGHHGDAAVVRQFFFHEFCGPIGCLGPSVNGFVVALFL